MNLFNDIARHVTTEAAFGLTSTREQRSEKRKWGAVFAVFALLSMLAFFIQKHSMDDADLLGGRKTIEKFMRSNIIAMVILIFSIVGFIILCFKTWKGWQSSIYQLIYVVGAGFIILFSSYSVFRSIHNIQKDLDSPITVTTDSYVLCKRGNDCLLVFDDQKSRDAFLLVIPEEKYRELRKGTVDSRHYLSRSWRLIEESEYTEYTEPELFSSKIEVKYYLYSVIYEDAGFVRTASDTVNNDS